jgi:outer membrane protein assembly factor BamB
MFRRSLAVWVIVSIVTGSSARAQLDSCRFLTPGNGQNPGAFGAGGACVSGPAVPAGGYGSARSPSPWISGARGRTLEMRLPCTGYLIPGRAALERLGLERQWFAVVPLVETERLIRISRSGDLLFAQTDYARLHTFDAETGRLLWTAYLGERSGFARGAVANSWAVFVTNANFLFALDRGTGRTIWRTSLGTLPTSPPAADESRVLVGLTDSMIKAFRLKSVDTKGNEHIRDTPFPLWSYRAGGPVRTRPLPAENIIAFGGGDNKAWVVMADEPTVLFRLPTGGAIGEGLGAYGTRTLLVPSADKALYAADILTGKVVWSFPSGSPIGQEPLVSQEDIYVINTAGDLTSLNPTDGQPRWTIPTQGGQLVSVSPTKIYLRSYNLDLFAVDRATGRMVVDPSESYLRAGVNLRDYDLNIVNRFNDRLYFATRCGLILALRETAVPQPILLRDPKQLPFGYIPPEGLQQTPPPAPAAEPGAAPDAQPGAEGEPAPKNEAEPAPKNEAEPAPKNEAEKPK